MPHRNPDNPPPPHTHTHTQAGETLQHLGRLGFSHTAAIGVVVFSPHLLRATKSDISTVIKLWQQHQPSGTGGEAP